MLSSSFHPITWFQCESNMKTNWNGVGWKCSFHFFTAFLSQFTKICLHLLIQYYTYTFTSQILCYWTLWLIFYSMISQHAPLTLSLSTPPPPPLTHYLWFYLYLFSFFAHVINGSNILWNFLLYLIYHPLFFNSISSRLPNDFFKNNSFLEPCIFLLYVFSLLVFILLFLDSYLLPPLISISLFF